MWWSALLLLSLSGKISNGFLVRGWLGLSSDGGFLVAFFALNGQAPVTLEKENRHPSPLPVLPAVHKVAIEMNLSESCFLELKPDSLGEGKTSSRRMRIVHVPRVQLGASSVDKRVGCVL